MSTDVKAHHQLKAILFADIQGFTALMERDEPVASKLLNKFQDLMYDKVSSFSGEVVNEMGDGMLCMFDSPNDAVRCAMSLQEKFRQSPRVPVRIGINSGTVVYEKEKIYGDSVNVASRIESIGVPGSILVSERIRNDLKNQPDILLTSLGKLRFKNIKEPIRVYAIANQGYLIPDKEDVRANLGMNKRIPKNILIPGLILTIALLAVLINNWNSLGGWLGFTENMDHVKKEKLAVLQFTNETGDSSLNYLGLFAANLISQRLSGVEDIKLVSSTLGIRGDYTEVLLSRLGFGWEFNQKSGLDNVISGTYYLIGDSIIFHSEIIKAQTGEVLKSFDEEWTRRDQPHRGIESLGQQILGFWINKDNPLFLREFPRADAYDEYLKAIALWSKDARRVSEHLERSLEMDSTFTRAYLLKGRFYSNMGRFDSLSSLIRKLEEIELDMEDGERNLYEHLKADLAGNTQLAYNYYLKEYELAPKNLFVNNSAMNMAMSMVNNSDDVIQFAEEIDHKLLDLNECYYCRSRISINARALINLGKYREALQLLAEIPPSDPIDISITDMEIRALARLGRTDELHNLIAKAENQRFSGGRDHNYFSFRAAEEFALLKDLDQVEAFARPSIKAFSEPEPPYHKRLGRIYILTKEFDLAEQHYEADKPSGGYYLAQLGAAKGFQGKEEEAIEIMNVLLGQRSPNFPGWADYFAAQIWTSLGNKKMALSALEKAISQGKRFYFWQFQYDPIFVDLFDDPEFQDLLEVN